MVENVVDCVNYDFNPRPTYVRRQKDANDILRKYGFQSSPHVCEATSLEIPATREPLDFNPRPTYVRRH